MKAYKSFVPEHVKASESGGPSGEGRVSFVVATLRTIDKDGDWTAPGAFGRQTVTMLPAHDWSHVPIGKGTLYEQGDQAVVDVKMNLRIPEARSWYEAIKFDSEHPPALQEYSYGYEVLDSAPDTKEGRRVRVLKSVRAFEVSPVVIGAGTGTRTLAVKDRKDGLSAADLSDLQRIQIKMIARENERQIENAAYRPELTKAMRRVSVDYSEVWPRVVPLSVRAAAFSAVDTYAPGLGLEADQMRVKWFSGEHDEEFADFSSLEPVLGYCRPKADPRVIWLRSDLDEADAWSVAAHELRHLAGGDEEAAQVFEGKARYDRSSQ